MARPTKLTPAVAERIVSAIRAGNFMEVAARYAGISPSTLYRWLERGDPDGTGKADNPYREFRAKVEQAQAEAEVRDVALIGKAAAEHWPAAAWRLTHRHRERWAPPVGGQPTEHAAPAKAAAVALAPRPSAKLDLRSLPREDLRALRELYARAGVVERD